MENGDNARLPEQQPPAAGPDVQPPVSDDRIVRANGVDLCVQTFGDSANLPILLIHGASTSMLQREAPYSPECVE